MSVLCVTERYLNFNYIKFRFISFRKGTKMNIFEILMGFNIYSVITRLLIATLFGGIIGIERGRHGRAAGLRTHCLVCLGSAMTALIGLFAANVLNNDGDILRISAQVISGIGFLGVGMILVRNQTIITGLTTAAGLWATATIGIAIGYGFYIGAFIAMILCVLIASLFGYFERKGKSVTPLYLEISDIRASREIVRQLQGVFDCNVSVDIVSPKSNISGYMGISLLVHAASVEEETFLKIESIEGVEFVVKEENMY